MFFVISEFEIIQVNFITCMVSFMETNKTRQTWGQVLVPDSGQVIFIQFFSYHLINKRTMMVMYHSPEEPG